MLKKFDCQVKIIDNFINNIVENTDGEISTTLVVDELHNVIGFFSLYATHRTVLSEENTMLESHIPCIGLAYLAVDKRYQGLGIGRRILTHIKKKLVPFYFIVGFKMIIGEALYQSMDFYLQNGFKELVEGRYENETNFQSFHDIYLTVNDMFQDLYGNK